MTNAEVDALVAEKVMGTPRPSGESIYEMYPWGTWMLVANSRDDSRHPGWIIRYGTDPSDCQRITTWWEPKPYSSDMRAAWEVVQRMKSWSRLPGKPDFCVDLCIKVCVGDGAFVEVFDLSPMGYAGQDGTFEYVCEHAETATLAICKAALRAIGEPLE